MKRIGSWVLAGVLASSLLNPLAWAQGEPPAQAEQSSAATVNAVLPQTPAVGINNYLVIDVTSGQILAEKNADEPVEPASLTKLMAAYVVFDALKNNRLSLDQTLTISARARNMEGSRMFVELNEQVRVEDLIKGMIVQSGNDATVALAEGVGGSVENFVDMMNKQASAMGMTKTFYKNPEGLTVEGHTTTARDLAILAIRLMADFPEQYKYYSIKEFTYPPEGSKGNSIPQKNRNRLLFIDPTVDGMKTGRTDAAGFCLVATAAREFPNLPAKRRVLSIVLGAKDDDARAQISQTLLNWGFQAWDDLRIADADVTLLRPKVWKSSASEVKLGLTESLIISIPRGTAGNVKSSATYVEPLVAPLTKGTEVGELKVTLETPSGSIQIASRKLVVLETVEEAGFFGRMWDGMRLWFN